jgi:predicted flavoprotein YhiN
MAKHAGSPLKRIAVTCGQHTQKGEAVITRTGLEGGALYALSHITRAALEGGPALIHVDLRPDLSLEDLTRRIEAAPAKSTWSNLLRKAGGLSPAAAAIVREAGAITRTAPELAARIKNIPVRVSGLSGLERAISTAGGIKAESVDDRLMLKMLPGVFVAGEMLDFDAPTGGYLLQAAFASGRLAAEGIATWLEVSKTAPQQPG